jgi:hypothetical protein
VENIFGPMRFRLIQVSLYLQQRCSDLLKYKIHLSKFRKQKVGSMPLISALHLKCFFFYFVCFDFLVRKNDCAAGGFCACGSRTPVIIITVSWFLK